MWSMGGINTHKWYHSPWDSIAVLPDKYLVRRSGRFFILLSRVNKFKDNWLFPGQSKLYDIGEKTHFLNFDFRIQHRYLHKYLNNHLLLKPLFKSSLKSLSNGLTLVKATSISFKRFTPIYGIFFNQLLHTCSNILCSYKGIVGFCFLIENKILQHTK